LSNKKLTNAELGQIIDTQKQTLTIIQQRMSQFSDRLALIQEDVERFKNAVARDMNKLFDRVD
jgi:hypothetical protein